MRFRSLVFSLFQFSFISKWRRRVWKCSYTLCPISHKLLQDSVKSVHASAHKERKTWMLDSNLLHHLFTKSPSGVVYLKTCSANWQLSILKESRISKEIGDSILFYSRLCPSTAGSSPPPESSIFLCPLLSWFIPLPVAPQCHLSNDVLVFRLILHPLSATLCF